jgi:Zn finger protein HypA/HybF involved in hydrogenase expression
MKKEAVAWCAKCQHYLHVNAAGSRCPVRACDYTLVKKFGYICEKCEERRMFGTKETLKKHEELEHP